MPLTGFQQHILQKTSGALLHFDPDFIMTLVAKALQLLNDINIKHMEQKQAGTTIYGQTYGHFDGLQAEP
jgi:hypothetical protein